MSKSEIISREKNIAHLRVELDVDEVNKQYKRIYNQLSNDMKIPGFRKGKIPANIIRQRVGVENINNAAEEQLKDFAVNQALIDKNLTPRQGMPTWHSDPEPEENKAIEYEFSIPVLPEVKLPDVASYELTAPKLEVSEGMKERYREKLAERYTQYPVKDAAADEGNAVTIAFSSKDKESGEDTGFKHDEMMFILGMEGNLPGWDEQLTGMKAGEEVEFDNKLPQDFADSRFAGKDLLIKVKVKSVHDVNKPEITEDFVKENLHVDSLEQFNEYIELTLKRETEAQFEQVKRDLTMQKVIDELEAEITDDMITDELDGLVKENDRSLRRYQSSLDQYLKEKGQNLQDYREQLKPAAISKIKLFLAVKTIAEEQQLNATDEDFQRYAMMLIQQEGIKPEQLTELMKHPEFMNEATYQIIKEKVLGYLAETAKFNVESKTIEEDASTTGESKEGSDR